MDERAAAGAISDGELGPRAASRPAGCAGPGPRSGDFPGAEPKGRAWSMAAACTSKSSAAAAGSLEASRGEADVTGGDVRHEP